MTSRIPPSQRDRFDLPAVLRQQSVQLGEAAAGLADGRFSGLGLLPASTWTDSAGQAADPGSVSNLYYRDLFTVAASGTSFSLTLTYTPIDYSTHVFWNGIELLPSSWSRVDNVLTVSDPSSFMKAGDQILVTYAYNEVAVTSYSSYVSTVIADGPLGYWRLGNDGSGGVSLLDSSGNGRHATSTHGTPLLTSPGGLDYLGDTAEDDGALESTSGTGGSISIPYGSWMDGLTSFSIELLTTMNSLPSTSYPRIIDLGATAHIFGNTGGYRLDVFWSIYYTYAVTLPTPYTPTHYHHMVFTFDEVDSKVRIYTDGALAATGGTSLGGPPKNNGGSGWTIGGNNGGGNYWPGKEDEVSIYGYALTEAQISNHYSQALG